ncbi:myb-like DNA-binding domain-containing protein [Sodiomyces alkalinus F11]|uniref:Myb-like DNA-binding domain-containing protein n=1 Tax=Sodiomyces alkalinus (strain CBS 110278 / VKM F-3762 / F11) TaxID=1314773 RepID=A0A3N2Q0J6_SODAK|nr:myb-like DNA-binding domain-containing protein [Sodiomyces alkalinus F11]ROT40283.1 myb-like DNA-binding domain-containing protein [Sodiomyces alkalinus F11]
MPPHVADSPAKKQSKWSPEEDALIIELRGSGMKWEDISKRLPGRSAISCRLHYQNYLERRSEWDEERKNKLARLYERFKPEMWAKIAEEMAVPWRAAEAMHWQLGEADMARRAGVVPFSLASASVDQGQGGARNTPSRRHAHSQSQGSVPRELSGATPRYGRAAGISPLTGGRTLTSRRESLLPPLSLPPPPTPPPIVADPNEGLPMGAAGSGLPPIHSHPPPRGQDSLPGLAELTTGVSPYNTPAYSMAPPGMSPGPPTKASPGSFLPPVQYQQPHEPTRYKRRASPGTDMGHRETSRRRH